MSLMKRTRKKKEEQRVRLNKDASAFLEHESGTMEPEKPTERTHKVTQAEILKSVAESARRNAWEHELPELAPFGVACSRNGRHGLIHGSTGYIAALDLHTNNTVSSLRVGEVVRDACYLHDETMFAAAQKKCLYIYDSAGTELHRIKQHIEPEHLGFLPYHWLLASVGRSGYLKYLDVSTGTGVSEHATKLGSALCMASNPQTAVLQLGHANGVVTMWSPASPKPLARVLAHRGGVGATAVAFDGTHFVTSGVDGYVKVWDTRTFRMLHSKKLKSAVAAVDISQCGLFAVATIGGEVQVYRDARNFKPFEPYLSHKLGEGKKCSSVAFRPYEDALLVGHSAGVASIIVPGAAEANYDALEANPYQTRKQRSSRTVRGLLDKIQPETITLAGDGFVGGLDRDPAALEKERRQLEEEADAHNDKRPKKVKKKMRGRSKIAAQLKRKSRNVITAETNALREKRDEEKAQNAAKLAGGSQPAPSNKKRRRGEASTTAAEEVPAATGKKFTKEGKSAVDRIFGK